MYRTETPNRIRHVFYITRLFGEFLKMHTQNLCQLAQHLHGEQFLMRRTEIIPQAYVTCWLCYVILLPICISLFAC